MFIDNIEVANKEFIRMYLYTGGRLVTTPNLKFKKSIEI